MSLDLIAKLSRADLLSVAAELSDDALKTALRSVVNVAAPTAPVAPPAKAKKSKAEAPAASTAPAAEAPKAEKPKAKAPAAPKAKAGSTEDETIAFAIAELAKTGFAVAQLAEATGVEARAPKLKRALDKAIEAGTLFKAGEKRFTRYGATAAIAAAAKK